jgi:ribosome maturation factor RimP
MTRDTAITPMLRSLAERAAESAGVELYHLEYRPAGGNTLLRVYIDAPSGVGLGECERMSKRLSAELELEDPIPGRYVLEVSSPGLDRVLATPDHFLRATGRMAVVKTTAAINGSRKHSGRISALREGILDLSLADGTVLSIPLDQISEAHASFEAGSSPR